MTYNKAFSYFDAFSGIGGFALGINQAHKNVFGKEAICAGYSEVNKYATSVYERYFREHKNYGDITEINTGELPDFDILTAGFPCQPFSITGKRGGFEDTRGTLFFELARILKDKRPSYFVFENVEGLVSHKNGRSFGVIIKTLDEVGYDLQWQVLNTEWHGLPQRRKRIFIVGNLRGRPRPQVFPIGKSTELFEERDEGITVGTWRTHLDGRGFRAISGSVSPTIPARAREDGSGQPVILVPIESYHGDITNLAIHDGKLIRRLTPLECERLQGFPDLFTLKGSDNVVISDAQRYKLLGNAVTVRVIEDIFSKLFEAIRKDRI